MTDCIDIVDGYVMGYSAPLDLRRIETFFDNKLDANALVLLAQDVIESGYAHQLGPKVYALVLHCLNQNFCTITGRYAQ